jgi:lysozyme
MARQQQLVNELGLYDPVHNPHGAAAPSNHAPHIKTGHPDHAIDFDNAAAVDAAAHKRGVELLHGLDRVVASRAEPGTAARLLEEEPQAGLRRGAGKKVQHVTVHVVKPPPKRAASDALLDFLAAWEGERLTAYKLQGESFFTIGVGHTGPVNGKPIHEGMSISRATSRKLLRADLATAENEVRKNVPDRWLRRQRRFDTCCSLAFNMGGEILTASPPLTSFGEVLKKPVNGKTIKEAVAAIQLYNKGGSPLRVMPGLVKRRKAEGVLLETGKYLHNV